MFLTGSSIAETALADVTLKAVSVDTKFNTIQNKGLDEDYLFNTIQDLVTRNNYVHYRTRYKCYKR